ncbi:hypothetical protein ACE6H2_022814 [Prunus campanulata]
MSRGSLLFATHIALLVLLVPPSFCFQTSTLEDSTLSCGNIYIRSPFCLKEDPLNCGDNTFELYCEENVIVKCFYSGKYYVKEINYSDWTIRVVDAGVHKKDKYFSNPHYSLTSFNLSDRNPFVYGRYTDTSIQELHGLAIHMAESNEGSTSQTTSTSNSEGKRKRGPTEMNQIQIKKRKGKMIKEIHEAQKERQSKCKYHHKSGRKGYVGVVEDLYEQNVVEKGEEIDRALLWKYARKD